MFEFQKFISVVESALLRQGPALHSERRDGGFMKWDLEKRFCNAGLAMVNEEGKKEDESDDKSVDADDELERSKAARIIQEKYRQHLKQRSREDIIVENANLC